MTGYDAPRPAGDEGPPFSLDLLADLHAGVLDDDIAADLRPRAEADPEARAILGALDATTHDLAQLPPLRMPDHVAARIDAALQAEVIARLATPPSGLPTLTAEPPAAEPPARPPAGATVFDLAARRDRRRRGLLAGAALLTAAAAVVAVVAFSNLTGGRTGGTPAASATNSSDQNLPPLAVSKDNLADALDDTLSMVDYGPLAAAGRLDACLAANSLDPDATKPLGAREVIVDGQPGILMILPTGTAARFRLLVVSPECGPNQPAVLADTTIGR